MIKKTITYPDLDGNEVTDDFYFGMNKAELAAWQLGQTGGMTKILQDMLASDDRRKILSTFQDLIGRSVGRRSENGKSFLKSDEIRNEFMGSEAYSILFMDILTDEAHMTAFIKGIMPSDLVLEVEKQMGQDFGTIKPEQVTEQTPRRAVVKAKKITDYTPEELMDMPKKDFDGLINRNKGSLPRHVILIAANRKDETD